MINSKNEDTERTTKEMWGVWYGSIAVDELQKVSHNLFMRSEACLQAEGGHFQHLL
jgi:hypothetical protein